MLDGSKAVGDGHARQATASSQSVSVDRGDAVWYGDAR